MKQSINNKRAVIIDLIVIAVLTAVVFILADYFSAFENLHKFIDETPREFELDEMFIGFIFLTFALAVFSLRRLKEVKRHNAMRAAAEEQLKESEEKYRLFLENIPDVTWTSDEHGRTIYISPNVEKVYGFTPEEIYADGKSCRLDRIHPEDVDRLLEQYGLLFSEEKPFDIEYRIRHKNGNWIWVYDRASNIHEIDGIKYTDGIFTEITERKHLEKERDRVFNLSLDLICVAGFDGLFRRINPTFVKALGYTEEYLMSNPFLTTVHPDDREELINEIKRLKTGESVFNFEFRRICADGTEKLFSWTAVPVIEEGLFYATGRDITERKKAEEERRVIFEIIQGVITTSNLDELLKLIHRSISRLFYAENCFVALHDKATDLMDFVYWVDKFDPAPPPLPVGKGFTSYVLRTGKPVLLTKELKTQMYERGDVERSGTDSASWVGVPLRSSAQTIGVLTLQHYENEHAYTERDLEFLSTVGDQIALAIERKRAEEALRESEQKLSLHIKQTPLAVMELNMDERITEWNHAAEKIFGYTKEEVLGRRASEFLVPESLKENIDTIWSDLITQKGGWRSTNENLTKDGRKIICEWYNTPLNAEGVVIGVASMAQDITESKLMEKDLERTRDEALESVRLKSEFLANMSHEIRTPMNGVIGMTSLLLDTDLTLEQRDFAETIQTSGESLLTIIDDILDFSKIEAGKLRFDSIDFDLREAVENSVELLAQRAQAKNLELASIVYNDVPTNLIGDPGRLRQVLTNLIGNGIKFTERGEVSVHVKKQGEGANRVTLRFEIVDTGIGISKEDQRRLFQAFTQADGSTTRKYGGTGLGLAISKQLVQLMGGEIGIKSTLDKGSVFWFTANFKRQPEAAITRCAEKTNFKDLPVLVVDDNETNRKIFVHHALSWGMSAVEAESGEQALNLLREAANRETPFELVILDLQMPGMDGIELARRIKADEKISDAHLVLLTSFSQRDIGEKALQAGISAHLTKPIRQSQLYNCLLTAMANAPAPYVKQLNKPTSQKTLNHEIRLRDERNSVYRILVAEDNLINQKVALSILTSIGYKAEAVANGSEVLEAYEREKYDLILMDCQMPVMDGYEATAEIRRREKEFSSHIPIIAMTAHALEGEREKCLQAGMDDYLSKPVKPQLLYEMLQRWLPLAGESQSEDFTANIPHDRFSDSGVVWHLD